MMFVESGWAPWLPACCHGGIGTIDDAIDIKEYQYR